MVLDQKQRRRRITKFSMRLSYKEFILVPTRVVLEPPADMT